GICAAACPAGAITMEVLDEQRIEDMLDFSGLPSPDPAIAVFACRGVRTGVPGAGRLKNTPLGRARLVELPAAAALRLEWVLKAFERGAERVVVMACGEGRCHFAGCETSLGGTLARAGEILEAAGISSESVLLYRPSPDGEPESLLSAIGAAYRPLP
ncbi:MAG: hydrogenase iron-sulfur subunit, partial [Firmicutes bacterium]|nr:hydrogenase iron-sulfur subunit [Bacillota bacterium]